MGIDIKAGGRRVGHKMRTAPKSKNVYLNLLVRLYRFLERRTDSKFCATVVKRLYMSKTNRPPMSINRVARYMKGKEDCGRRVGHKMRTAPKSKNVYLNLLVRLYRFLERRTDSKFCATVVKRLYMSKTNRPPMSINRVARYMKGKEDKVAVLVGTVTNDVRLLE
eukprot:CAMPEP_0206416320 /NCGR_PEP_ID=MMETSP0294-20121207/36645_1 /ASSEMBLY_ACC=CAM_ASM_000327 /TAXON_ID=39354 /ORGANISM="Heterosigma akashiwo, Strain CCMP2393" /LENGTH=164 /DNA_ID=CAMNT_0053878889 /DNA_START=1 /DNA_END=492 /DNA_ORIENTATION=+